jgi:hypothetical protein
MIRIVQTANIMIRIAQTARLYLSVCAVADVLECTDMQPTEGIGVVREVEASMVARGRGSCKSLPTPTLIIIIIFLIYCYYFLTTYSCSNGNIT